MHSDKFRQLSRQSFASLVLWAAYGLRTELDVHPACPLSSPGSISTNVLGPILTIQEAIKQFGFEEGRVINISSLAGSHFLPNGILYSATKAAVENLTQGLSAELGSRRIRVNAIAPGYTRSEGTAAEGLLCEENVKRYISFTPLGRLGEPGDIAAVAVFLASYASSWVTGETIRVGGGAR